MSDPFSHIFSYINIFPKYNIWNVNKTLNNEEKKKKILKNLFDIEFSLFAVL